MAADGPVVSRPPAHYRSTSLPGRISSVDVTGASTISLAPAPALAAAANLVTLDPGFERGTQSVLDCKEAVRSLTAEANKARSYREKCSQVMGAALGASLALQEALASPRIDRLRPIRVELQVQVTEAEALVRKYGSQGRLEGAIRRFFAWEDRYEVDAKFDATINALHALADQTWELIPNENRIKRSTRDPRAAVALRNGHAFALHRLRNANQFSVHALLYFKLLPEQQHDHLGCVAYSANRGIKVHDLGVNTSILIDCGGVDLPRCLAHDPEGYLWSGHDDGTIRLWGTYTAAAAATPLHISGSPVTVIALDGATGLLWVGTMAGEVAIVRRCASGTEHFCRLELVRMLLGYDAHSPASSGHGALPSHVLGYGGSSSGSGGLNGVNGMNGHQRTSFETTHSSSSAATGAGLLPNGGGGISAGTTGMGRLQDCLPMGGSGGGAPNTAFHSSKGYKVHLGPVRCVVICHGRVYTAGGDSKTSSEVLVWDAGRQDLLSTVSKRTRALYSSPVTALTCVTWAQIAGAGRTGSGNASACEWHVFSGHASGEVIMWEPRNNSLQPVLHLGRQRRAVRALVVCEELSLLCAGHESGTVVVRKLEPTWRVPPRDGAAISKSKAQPALLNSHRLGLLHMVGGGQLIVTSGGSGSIKVYPEATLRCAANAAGMRLPRSHDASVTAINDMLGQQLTSSRTLSSVLMSSREPSSAPSHQASGRLPSESSSGGTPLMLPPSQRVPSGQLPTIFSGKGDDERAAAAGAAVAATDANGRAARAAAAAAAAAAAPRGSGMAMFDDDEEGVAGEAVDAAPARLPSEASTAAGISMGPTPSGTHRRLSSFVRESRRSAQGALVMAGFENASWNIHFADIVVRGLPVGEGSYGKVYKGRWKETDVAVKLFHLGRDGHWDVDAMRQEVEILSELRHPNVVELLGVCLDQPAVVTTFYHHGSLYDVLQKARNGDAQVIKRLTWRQRLQMALEAATGMNYLHTNKPPIVHRDLKSPNLMVDQYYRVKVGDFNLSRYLDANASVVSGPENNPRWSAPEVFDINATFSKESDVYSFGVVLWELLTWKEPWESENLKGFQIMTATRDGQRPLLPPAEELPGGPHPGLEEYIALLEECWSQDIRCRPSFTAIIQRLNQISKAIPRSNGPSPSPPMRGRSEPQLAGVGDAQHAAAAAANGAAAGAAVAGHKRSASAAAAPVGDLITLDDDYDGVGMLGPSQPLPPAAALPPVEGPPPPQLTEEDGLPLAPSVAAAQTPPHAPLQQRQRKVSPFVAMQARPDSVPDASPAANGAQAAALPSHSGAPGPSGAGGTPSGPAPVTLSDYVAAASAVTPAAPSPAGGYAAQQPVTPQPEAQAAAAAASPFAAQQQQQRPAVLSPFAAAAAAGKPPAGARASPFAAAAAMLPQQPAPGASPFANGGGAVWGVNGAAGAQSAAALLNGPSSNSISSPLAVPAFSANPFAAGSTELSQQQQQQQHQQQHQ